MLNFGIKFGKVINGFQFIDWPTVARHYKGIEISGNLHTYFDTARQANNNSFLPWFYGVDVEGGCLWDLSAITKFEKIGQDWCLHSKNVSTGGGSDTTLRTMGNYIATIPLLLTVIVYVVWETCAI